MAGRASGWDGDFHALANCLRPLYTSGGRALYESSWDACPKVDRIAALTPQILEIASVAPKLNVLWSTFSKAILHIALSKDSGVDGNKTQKKTFAGDEATQWRCMLRHIRREWYRKSTKEWMLPFVSPVAAASESSAVVAACRSWSDDDIPDISAAEVQRVDSEWRQRAGFIGDEAISQHLKSKLSHPNL